MRPGAGEPERARTALVAAAVDIGSNSVLLLTVAVEPGGPVRAVDEALATTRLGTGLRPGGSLDPGGRARTRAAVAAFAARARAAGARRTWAFATGAARDAIDGAAFAAELAALTGVPVELLSGEREASLAYAAVRAGLGLGDGALVVADVGGRTTELSLGAADRVSATASLPLGALVLAEAHGADRSRLAKAAAAGLAGNAVLAAARERGTRLAVSGGTATALAALDLGLTRYEPRRVHGHVLRRETLAALAARAATHGPPGSGEAERESARVARGGSRADVGLGASEERSAAHAARAPHGPPGSGEAERESARAGRRGLGASEERSAAHAARAPHGPPGWLDPDRAAILPAGAVILDRIAAAVGASELLVSEHGVRHGYLAQALAAEGVPADFRRLWS